MKLKKIALKGLIILAVTVALCMFFANTVQTITTPKVQIIQGSRGNLEQKLSLPAQVYFPETVDYTLAEAQKTNIVIDKVYVRVGHHVEEGETLFTAKMPSFEEDMKTLQGKYDEKVASLAAKDIEHRKDSKASKQNELYDAMMKAQTALSEDSLQTRVAAMAKGVTLSEDLSLWSQQASASAADEALIQTISKTLALKATYEEARTAFFNSYENKKIRLDPAVFAYINERNALLEEINDITKDMMDLSVRQQELAEIRAPKAGYVVTMDLKNGDTYDGKKAAFTLSDETVPPVLRADISSLDKTVEDGAKVEVAGDYGSEKTTVEKTVLESDGKKYAYITLTENIASIKGGITRMLMDGSMDVSLTYKAKQAATLLPASAVRNEGEGQDYIYTIERTWGGFMGQSAMKVHKTSVTVMERGDKVVSIQEQMDYQEIADREDRALSDNGKVMEYID